jgi:hypothetical protein
VERIDEFPVQHRPDWYGLTGSHEGRIVGTATVGGVASTGNLSHSMVEGHVNPNLFINGSHPDLADRQSWRLGSRVVPSLHFGAYNAHRNGLRSGEQLTLTSGKN